MRVEDCGSHQFMTRGVAFGVEFRGRGVEMSAAGMFEAAGG